MGKSTSINPTTGQTIKTYNHLTDTQLTARIETANEAYQSWKSTSFEHRALLMHNLASILQTNKAAYAQLITSEMGKMIGQAEAEIEKCIWVCEFYATHAAEFLANEIVETEASKSYIAYQPMGVILAIMPWNFPFYQVIRFIAPATMAGNVGILKHASNVQGCALALEAAFIEAGFPEGILTNVTIDTSQVESIIEHPAVIACTLTGSEPAGRAVAALAGKNLKKTVMELGGSDPYVFLEDIDMEMAVELAVQGRLHNTGQTCIAAKRLIVLDAIYDKFVEKFTAAMRATSMGNPLDATHTYGPMAREDLRDELHEQVQKSIEQGARLVMGGVVEMREGAFYSATILAEVEPGMVAFDEELFGPVAAIIRARDEAHAIALANQTSYGLGAGVITADTKRGERIALQLEAGNCTVNKLVGSDPRMPFGGIKNSGYGRELSKYGMREFVNIKSVWIQ